MKRVNITEEQFQSISQKLNKMRNDTSALKLSELKCYARDAIDKAFRLGRQYSSLFLLDIEGRKSILQKLNSIINHIDNIK